MNNQYTTILKFLILYMKKNVIFVNCLAPGSFGFWGYAPDPGLTRITRMQWSNNRFTILWNFLFHSSKYWLFSWFLMSEFSGGCVPAYWKIINLPLKFKAVEFHWLICCCCYFVLSRSWGAASRPLHHVKALTISKFMNACGLMIAQIWFLSCLDHLAPSNSAKDLYF